MYCIHSNKCPCFNKCLIYHNSTRKDSNWDHENVLSYTLQPKTSFWSSSGDTFEQSSFMWFGFGKSVMWLNSWTKVYKQLSPQCSQSVYLHKLVDHATQFIKTSLETTYPSVLKKCVHLHATVDHATQFM